MYTKMNLLEFQKRFATEEACLQYLLQRRWPDGFVCPRCECGEAYWLKKRRLMQCKACRYQASVTAGTIFHKTRVPLRSWFWMIFLISRQKTGCSMLGIQRLVGIGSYRTAWMMGHKIRQAMSCRNDCYQLQSLVQLDDSYFGGKHRGGKRGRGTPGKTPVVVCVEMTQGKPGFVSMDVVETMEKANVLTVARKRIELGSHIHTDAFRAFGVLAQAGYPHQKTRLQWLGMGIEEFPWVHTVIANCKNQLRAIQKGVSRVHLPRYLAEFCYRFNRRFWEQELFNRLLTACTQYPTVTYAELSA